MAASLASGARRALALSLFAQLASACDGASPPPPVQQAPAPAPAPTAPAPATPVAPATPPAPAPPVATTAPPATPPAPPPLGVDALSASFPEVRVVTRYGFAHDFGDTIDVDRVEVGGKPCPPQDTLACLVAHRGGWNPGGGRSDDDALRTVQAFVEAWDKLLEVHRLTEAAPPPEFFVPHPRTLPGKPPEPQLVYHPPRYELRDDQGERVVLATYFVRGHISQRGQHWSYQSVAFRVRDGARHPIGPGSSLPQPRHWSEGGH